jgi:dipeptidyl aminopeptidase/acylaminoacyl peptidase
MSVSPNELGKAILVIMLVVLLASCVQNDKTIVRQEKTIMSLKRVQMPVKQLDDVEVYNLRYKSDGLKIGGYVVKPKKIKGKAPVLLFNRGGNDDDGLVDSNLISFELSAWARQGFVVIASQYRGNQMSEGKDEFGGADVDDVLQLVKVAKELPYADSKKVVMLGYSRGGLMAYLAAKKGIPIKAMAVVGGITDLIDTYNNREQAMKDVLDKLVGSPDSEEKYKDRSAIYWADKINVPTLILHGHDDWRVSVKQADELAQKLKEDHKVFKYISYPKGDHSLQNNWKESHLEILNWFNKYLNK